MSRQRQKGTRWESRIRDYLQGEGVEVHRQPAHGTNDKGDLHIGTDVIIEAKDQARHSLAEWLDEATIEAHNAHRPIGAVWFHRRGKTSPAAGYVLLDGATFVQLLREAGMTGRPPAVLRRADTDVQEDTHP